MHGSGVVLRDVAKTFSTGRSAVSALEEIDLNVSEGEFVTLFGPSGCGKSTLLRIVAGLETETSGEVSVFGAHPSDAARRKNVAWIPQSSALLPWLGIHRNADLSSAINRRADRHRLTSRVPEDAGQVLSELGLGGFTKARPAALSGGMRQRASIARGFTQGAPIMLMDEPFSALDELTTESLRWRLLDMWEQHRKTIMFVTHSAFEAVLLSDRVVVMTPRPGRVHAVVDVDLPRPRTPEMTETEELHAKVAEVKHVLRSGWEGGE